MITVTGSLARLSNRVAISGLLLIAAGWILLWSIDSYWNPLAFVALWTGVALVGWGVSADGYPGIRRHIGLAAVSVPIWWWFELVNARIANWHYVFTPDYSDIEYSVFATLAFSTVVPALVATAAALRSLTGLPVTRSAERTGRIGVSYVEIALGLLLQGAVFLWPDAAFPFVWIAPFLVVDGSIGLLKGSNPSATAGGGISESLRVAALAGLLCGGLWEFWNFWSMPKREYTLPAFEFAHIFEMPLLGYGGYIPFAMFVLRATVLVDMLWQRSVGSHGASSPRIPAG